MTRKVCIYILPLILWLIVKDGLRTTLDQARNIKSLLEGSSESYVPLQVEARPLVDLKQLVLMHVPTSVSDVSRQKFTDLISEMLSGMAKSC